MIKPKVPVKKPAVAHDIFDVSSFDELSRYDLGLIDAQNYGDK